MTRWNRFAFAFLALLLSLGVVASTAHAKKKEEDPDKSKKLGLSKQVSEKLTAAYELFDQGNADGALEVVDALVKRRKLKPPEMAHIHRFRGYIFADKGKYDKAVEEWEKSLTFHGLAPNTEQDLIYSLAQMYTQLDKFDKALDLINQWFATAENPKPDAYFLKGMILVQQEKFKEAAEPVAKAIELADKPKESWLTTQGVIHSNLQEFDKVEEILAKLVEIAPQKMKYWTQLAAVQNHLGKEEKALATMGIAYEAQILKGDKQLRLLASLLFLQQQPYYCAKVIDDALASGAIKADSNAYRLISNCFIAARENEKAFAPLAKAGELSPDADMYMLLGQMYLQRDKFAPALEALQKALAKAKPEQRGSVHLLIGIGHIGTEQLDEAERNFKAALADPKVKKGAESYLKFIEDKKMRDARSRRSPPRTAAAAEG